MASIEIILRDEAGNIITRKTQKQYALNFSEGRIGDIEGAVEAFKRESLSDMTHDLLAHVQQQQIEQIKKTNRSCVMGRVR